MKTILKLVSALCVAVTFTACGLSNAMTSNHNITQTNVELASKNYKVIGEVSGEATSSYVFFIGGMSKKALQANANAEMMKNAKLEGSKAIINVSTYVHNVGFAPFYVKKKITSSAQIIEFTE